VRASSRRKDSRLSRSVEVLNSRHDGRPTSLTAGGRSVRNPTPTLEFVVAQERCTESAQPFHCLAAWACRKDWQRTCYKPVQRVDSDSIPGGPSVVTLTGGLPYGLGSLASDSRATVGKGRSRPSCCWKDSSASCSVTCSSMLAVKQATPGLARRIS
jgi:hypothetical protein